MKKPNTPNKYCKKFGLTLSEVSKLSGVSTRTLSNWHKDEDRPDLFKVVVIGCYFLSRVDYFIAQLSDLKDKTED